ncbi:hypothetical protein [Mesorhizobium dulcispinae]|uniref:hypothetical protein n=1 Tax=Mesorhizobium dulcispinae TaxID=3072316 RepID=UPI002A24E5A0|nr:hypothetical protein [Mesorhizobium sp. VK23D]MDX8521144.1 hypothetical protein [Mesorhizobium sp. VK23D]
MRLFMICVWAMLSTSPLCAQEKMPLGSTKSLSVGNQGGIELWKPSEIEQGSQEAGELKSLSEETKPPKIEEKRLVTPLGTVVFAQLWDLTCASLCQTKVLLEKPDGTVKVLLDDVLPQIRPEEESKSLKIDNQVSISEDLKTLWVDTDDGVQTFQLNN